MTICLVVSLAHEGAIHPTASMDKSLGFQEIEAPRIYRKSGNKSDKFVSPKNRPPGDTPDTYFCKTGRIKPVKNSSDPI
jgi:hypothetical protein